MSKKTKKQALSLSKNAKKYIRGIAHHINPLVTVADKGITENILNELDICLDHHELVKIKIRADRQARDAIVENLIQASQAEKVQSIGGTLTLFRPNLKKPVYELPQ